ncbi:hypothetical protein ACNPON_17610 [Glutamicibacter sp. AGC13]
MEISVWLPSAAAVFVGLGSTWITTRALSNSAQRIREEARVDALRSYELALFDMAEYWYSEATSGVGRHSQPGDRLEQARINAYPYLPEFEDTKVRGALFSPEPFISDGFFPGTVADHFYKLGQKVEDHLRKFPKGADKAVKRRKNDDQPK